MMITDITELGLASVSGEVVKYGLSILLSFSLHFVYKLGLKQGLVVINVSLMYLKI